MFHTTQTIDTGCGSYLQSSPLRVKPIDALRLLSEGGETNTMSDAFCWIVDVIIRDSGMDSDSVVP